MLGEVFTLVSFLPLSLTRFGPLEWKREVKREEGAAFRTSCEAIKDNEEEEEVQAHDS